MDCEKYLEKCKITMCLIKSEFPDVKLEYSMHEDLVQLFINDRGTVCLKPDCKWNNIKRSIDKIIGRKFDKECSICCNKTVKQNCFCECCSNSWCPQCYIDIFRQGKGLIKCPFCRHHIIGEEFPDFMVEIGVEAMKDQNDWHEYN